MRDLAGRGAWRVVVAGRCAAGAGGAGFLVSWRGLIEGRAAGGLGVVV